VAGGTSSWRNRAGVAASGNELAVARWRRRRREGIALMLSSSSCRTFVRTLLNGTRHARNGARAGAAAAAMAAHDISNQAKTA